MNQSITMGSTRYTQDELKMMRTIMLQDPVFGSPEYITPEVPTPPDLSPVKQYETVETIETAFSGSLSFNQIIEPKEEVITVVEEKIETLVEQPVDDTDKKTQQIAIKKFIATPKIPDLGGKLLKTTENIGKATEATFDAALDLFKMILGREKPKPAKEKDPKKAQEEALMNKQNAAIVEQAVKETKVISESRAQKDFQRIAGDEIALMSDEAKKKILNLQTGLERKFTAKDAADLRNSLIEQKKEQEKQKTAISIKSASKGPNLDKNFANEQGVSSIYNTAG